MTEQQIADILFKEVDQQKSNRINKYPKNLAEIKVYLLEDGTGNCRIEYYEILNEKYKIYDMFDESNADDFSGEFIDNHTMLVVDTDIYYDGDLDLGVLFYNEIKENNAIFLGNITVIGTLKLGCELSCVFLGNVKAAKIYIESNGIRLFNKELEATDYIYEYVFDAYVDTVRKNPKAPLYFSGAKEISFIHHYDKSTVIIDPYEDTSWHKEQGYQYYGTEELKDVYLLGEDGDQVDLDRLVYAIKNNIPFLKTQPELTLK